VSDWAVNAQDGAANLCARAATKRTRQLRGEYAKARHRSEIADLGRDGCCFVRRTPEQTTRAICHRHHVSAMSVVNATVQRIAHITRRRLYLRTGYTLLLQHHRADASITAHEFGCASLVTPPVHNQHILISPCPTRHNKQSHGCICEAG